LPTQSSFEVEIKQTSLSFVIFAESNSELVAGTYGNTNSQIIYGVFNTAPNAIAGSAICAFSLQVTFLSIFISFHLAIDSLMQKHTAVEDEKLLNSDPIHIYHHFCSERDKHAKRYFSTHKFIVYLSKSFSFIFIFQVFFFLFILIIIK
jgi:hypothetical protein